MELWLIRHGDPDYARDDLTERGELEAKLLAESLVSSARIDDICASPLGRAQKTCSYTAEKLGIQPVTLAWLREEPILREQTYLWEAPGKMFLGAELPAAKLSA